MWEKSKNFGNAFFNATFPVPPEVHNVGTQQKKLVTKPLCQSSDIARCQGLTGKSCENALSPESIDKAQLRFQFNH